MKAMSVLRVTAFLDTNVFLHYRPLDELDWCSILQADTVEIKIAPVVTRELEAQKTLHQSGKIRERATTALNFLRKYLGQKPPREVREGVTLDFLVKEPTPEFATARDLNLQLGDDRSLGTLLLYREANVDAPCVLVTGDLPLTVKAAHYEVDLIVPSETFLLPTEADPSQKKLKQLEAELVRYKSREPV